MFLQIMFSIIQILWFIKYKDLGLTGKIVEIGRLSQLKVNLSQCSSNY